MYLLKLLLYSLLGELRSPSWRHVEESVGDLSRRTCAIRDGNALCSPGNQTGCSPDRIVPLSTGEQHVKFSVKASRDLFRS